MTKPRALTRTIDNARHYPISIDGVEYQVPSANTLLRLLDAPALKNWLINRHIDEAVDHLDALGDLKTKKQARSFVRSIVNSDTEKRDFGDAVHYAAEEHLRGEGVTDPELEWVGSHLTEFALEFDAEVVTGPDGNLMIERTCFREIPDAPAPAWAGTFDAMFEITHNGERKRLIVDHKSGASGVWPDAAISTGMYYHATHLLGYDGITHHPMPKANGAAVLWLRPEGWALIPLRVAETEALCLALSCVYHWKAAHEGRAVLDPINSKPLRK